MPTITAARIIPPPPRVGDTVAVVAPAGPVPEEQLRTGVELLESWGLRVRVGDHVRDRHPRLAYLAGSDADRAADLERAWCDPEISAVLCARGGYGSVRILPRLDWPAMERAPGKLLVGSSDATALHETIGPRLGMAGLFGPMIATRAFTEDATAREHLRRALFEPAGTRLSGPHSAALRSGRAAGVTHGGNLSVLAGLLGSGELPEPPNPGLALLEDVTEQPYQLDRYLTQLKRAGWFETTTGVVLGSWQDCGPVEGVRATLLDILGDLGVPVLWELGFGHCDGQLTVPLGVSAELDAEAGTLTLDGTGTG
ncbi:S66 peptidase family protein [Actinopolyspora alba]|uniref:S66 peptidase family protein n=1 Tax=Actinopolyspora alba TaxID=673379 RepID=UPI000B80D193|nr:LD-carboxypeptidase [Actinopolyspora alba]